MAMYEEDFIAELTIENNELLTKLAHEKQEYAILRSAWKQQVVRNARLLERLDRIEETLDSGMDADRTFNAIYDILFDRTEGE